MLRRVEGLKDRAEKGLKDRAEKGLKDKGKGYDSRIREKDMTQG